MVHIDSDRSEAHDLAEQEPERLKENLALEFKVPVPPSGVYTYYPETLEVPERSAANTHGVSYRILAEVELTDAAEGVIMAHGSRFGGHALFIKDHKLHYVYNFLGIPPEQRLAGETPLAAGKHILGVDFAKESVGEHGESHGSHALRRRPGGRDDNRSARRPGTSRSAAKACASASTAATTSPGNTATGSRSPAARSNRSNSTSATRAYVDVERHLEAAFSRY